MKNRRPYRILAGKRWRYFDSLLAAKAVAERVFERTGVVVAIELTPVD